LIVLSLILFTIFLFSYIFDLSLIAAYELFSFRLFNISYDLAFRVINSDRVFLDLGNSFPLEFNNIIELWLKPILERVGFASYKLDTIPKYIDYLITGGELGYGFSSPNSSLFIETTIIHGRFLGSMITSFILLFGVYVRRRFIESRVVDTSFIIFIPLILKGPIFCFNVGSSFFTGYLFCYLSIVLICDFLIQITYRKNYILKE